jgi:hypothetical protein
MKKLSIAALLLTTALAAVPLPPRRPRRIRSPGRFSR